AREQVGLALGVRPEQEMTHLVVDHLNPPALAEIDPSAFPVFRMHQMDAAVFVGAACGLAPIDVLEPFDTRAAQFEVSAHRRNRAVEMRGAMAAEKFGEVAINFAAMSDRGNNHSHEQATSSDSTKIIRRRIHQSQTSSGKCQFIPMFDFCWS